MFGGGAIMARSLGLNIFNPNDLRGNNSLLRSLFDCEDPVQMIRHYLKRIQPYAFEMHWYVLPTHLCNLS